MKISMIFLKGLKSDITNFSHLNIHNRLYASKQTHTIELKINPKESIRHHVCTTISAAISGT